MNHGFKLHPDGTLEITMPKGKKVGRVLVCEEGSWDGALYYRDGDVPDINVGDMISRHAAIEALKVAYWDNDIQSAKDDPCIVDAMTDWAIRQVKALPSAEPEHFKSCKNCIHLGHAYMMPCKNCRRNQMMPDWYEVEHEK